MFLNVPGFENIELIHSKRQPPNLNKLLTKVQFSNKKQLLKNAKNDVSNFTNHCCYRKSIHFKM